MDGYTKGDACAPDARNNGEKAGRMVSAELSTMFNRSTSIRVCLLLNLLKNRFRHHLQKVRMKMFSTCTW